MDFNRLHGRSEHDEEGVLIAKIAGLLLRREFSAAEKRLSNSEGPVSGSGYNSESDGACQPTVCGEVG
jgi:hypothetical protein